ncbi:class I SAM-dependent methyltransferase [Roseofilum sp. Guam]|uniref:class I SAM-dependent methyltransferase n=1 Tax=Roseofilum sp. Guam TaxID=2821502 RepID=UPI001B23CFF4|nr:class I SAM-dependent methyltransferase [Roseofilum sp. Guam]MBP0030968.1 class I SAM-dependent methyltransferase [Roseofilum sp. Guam]
MTVTDLYQGMSDFYNAFVQRNRDYQAIATDLIDLFGDGQTILDVGIGTGLLVEQILHLRPNLRVVGVDTSASLLEQAEECLGSQVELYCEDISNLSVDKLFDIAYSRGGAWAFVNDGDHVLLASHILDLATLERSFERVAAHLCDGGRLIIISSNSNHTKQEQLDDNIVFERKITQKRVDDEQYLILDYHCYHQKELVGQQQVKMRLVDLESVEKMLEAVGLISISNHESEYHVYEKRSC